MRDQNDNLEFTLGKIASMVNSDLNYYKGIVNAMTDEEFDELQERIYAFNLCQSRAAKMLNADKIHAFLCQVNSTKDVLTEGTIKIDKATNTFTDENGDIFPCDFDCRGMGILNWENFLERRAEAGLEPIPASILSTDKIGVYGEVAQHSWWDYDRFKEYKDSLNSRGESIKNVRVSEAKVKKASKKKVVKETRVPRTGTRPITADTVVESAKGACVVFENFLKEKGFTLVSLDAAPIPKSYRVREEINDRLIEVSIDGNFEDEVFIKMVDILAIGFMYHLESANDPDFVHIGESIQDMLQDAEYVFRFA